jgi:hypothetical protein
MAEFEEVLGGLRAKQREASELVAQLSERRAQVSK